MGYTAAMATCLHVVLCVIALVHGAVAPTKPDNNDAVNALQITSTACPNDHEVPRLLCHGHHIDRFKSCTSPQGLFVFAPRELADGTAEFHYSCAKTFDTIVTHLHRGLENLGLKSFAIQAKDSAGAWDTLGAFEFPMMPPSNATVPVSNTFPKTTSKSWRVTFIDGYGGGGSGETYFIVGPLLFELSEPPNAATTLAPGGAQICTDHSTCITHLQLSRTSRSNATCAATGQSYRVGMGVSSAFFAEGVSQQELSHNVNLFALGTGVEWGAQCMSQGFSAGVYNIHMSVTAIGEPPLTGGEFFMTIGDTGKSLLHASLVAGASIGADGPVTVNNTCVHFVRPDSLWFYTRDAVTTWGVEIHDFVAQKYEHSCSKFGTTNVLESCANGNYTYKCECHDNYQGDFCEITVDGCETNPCLSDSVCTAPRDASRNYTLWGPNTDGVIVFQHSCNCSDPEVPAGVFGKNCQYHSICGNGTFAVKSSSQVSSVVCEPRTSCADLPMGSTLHETAGKQFSDNMCSSELVLRRGSLDSQCSGADHLYKISRPKAAQPQPLLPSCVSQPFEAGAYYLELQVKATGSPTRKCEEFFVSRDQEGGVEGPGRTKLARVFAPHHEEAFNDNWQTVVSTCVEMRPQSSLSFYLGCDSASWGVEIRNFKFLPLYDHTCNEGGTESVSHTCKNGEHVFECICKEGVEGELCGEPKDTTESFQKIDGETCGHGPELGTYSADEKTCQEKCFHNSLCAAFEVVAGTCKLFGDCPQSHMVKSEAASLSVRSGGIVGMPMPETFKWQLVAEVGATDDTSPDFWKEQCQRISKVGEDWGIKVEMGNVVDYFKGKPGAKLCDVLTSGSGHLWSATEQGPYVAIPSFDVEATSPQVFLGGSHSGFPRVMHSWDKRDFVSFWGGTCTLAASGESKLGGCCSQEYTTSKIESSCSQPDDQGECNFNADSDVATGSSTVVDSVSECISLCDSKPLCMAGYFVNQTGPTFGQCWLAGEKATTPTSCGTACISFVREPLDAGASTEPLHGLCDAESTKPVVLANTVTVKIYTDKLCSALSLLSVVDRARYGRSVCTAMGSGFAQFFKTADSVQHAYYSDSECLTMQMDGIATTCGATCQPIHHADLPEPLYAATDCNTSPDGSQTSGSPARWNQPFKLYVKGASVAKDEGGGADDAADDAQDDEAEKEAAAAAGGGSPPPRMYHAMVTEATNIHQDREQRAEALVFMFGGANRKSSVFPKFAWGGPKRKSEKAAYKGLPVNQLQLLDSPGSACGSIGGSVQCKTVKPEFETLNDIWAFSWKARRWISFGDMTTAFTGLMMHTVVHNPTTNTFLLFGGTPNFEMPSGIIYEARCFRENTTCIMQDLTVLSDDEWKQPAPRFGHVAVFLEHANKMLVFGGRTSSRIDGRWSPKLLNDMWSYDVTSMQWQQVLTTSSTRRGNLPEPRFLFSGTLNGRVETSLVIFGGKGKFGMLGDTWEFNLETESWRQVPYLTSKLRDPEKPYLGEITMPVPEPRAGHQVVYKGSVIYVTGGWRGSAKQCESVRTCSRPSMDMWKMKITADGIAQPWVKILGSLQLEDLQGHGMVNLETYDDGTFDNKLVVFGGDRWSRYLVVTCEHQTCDCDDEEQNFICPCCVRWTYNAWRRLPQGKLYAFSILAGDWFGQQSILR